MSVNLISLALVSLCFVGCSPKHHTATVKIQLLDPLEESVQSGLEMNSLGPAINVNANSSILASNAMLTRVAKGLRSRGVEQDFVAPYKETATGENVRFILESNRWIKRDEGAQVLELAYAHPDPNMAVKVANIYAEAFIDFLIELRMKSEGMAVEDLSIRAGQQKDLIRSLEEKVEAFRLKHDIPVETHSRKEDDLRKKLEETTARKRKGEEVNTTEIEEELIRLSKLRIEYNSLLRDLNVQESFYDTLSKRLADEKQKLEQRIEPNAFIVERAAL